MEGCSFTVGADRSDLPEVVQPNIAINTSGGMPTAKAEEENDGEDTPDAYTTINHRDIPRCTIQHYTTTNVDCFK